MNRNIVTNIPTTNNNSEISFKKIETHDPKCWIDEKGNFVDEKNIGNDDISSGDIVDWTMKGTCYSHNRSTSKDLFLWKIVEQQHPNVIFTLIKCNFFSNNILKNFYYNNIYQKNLLIHSQTT